MGEWKMKKILFVLFFILCMVLAAAACTEALEAVPEAEEITSACTFDSNGKESKANAYSLMTDQDVSTY